MATIKGKCKIHHKALEGIIDYGDVVEITSKETMLEFDIKTVSGKIITTKDLIGLVGLLSLGDIFERLED